MWSTVTGACCTLHMAARYVMAKGVSWEIVKWLQLFPCNSSISTSHTLSLLSPSPTPFTSCFIAIRVGLLTTSNYLPYQPILHLMYHTLMNLLSSLKGPLLIILFHQSSLGGVQWALAYITSWWYCRLVAIDLLWIFLLHCIRGTEITSSWLFST